MCMLTMIVCSYTYICYISHVNKLIISIKKLIVLKIDIYKKKLYWLLPNEKPAQNLPLWVSRKFPRNCLCLCGLG